jgi:phosphatidate phosphatase APP1
MMSRMMHVPGRPFAATMGFAVLLLVLLNGCATIARQGPAAGQEVAFFPSAASLVDDNEWSIRIQGRIFEPPDSSSPVRQKLIDLLALRLHADPKDTLYRERAGYFVSDSIRNTQVSVKIGDRTIPLSPSNAAGYFTTDTVLPKSEVEQLARDGVITFSSVPTDTNSRPFFGTVRLVPEEGVTVVTDIDDTIKVTNMHDSKEKEANTFLRPFTAVTGMPELYGTWKRDLGERIHFHVVSAGPWQFNEPLRRFFEEVRFPPFTWDMRSIDIGGDIVVDLREASPDLERVRAFKVEKIRALIARFPKRSFVLVGDSGERDPEVYSSILSEFPERVDAVFIRDVTGEDRTASRYRKLFPCSTSDKLRVFRNPSELPALTSMVVDDARREESRQRGACANDV